MKIQASPKDPLFIHLISDDGVLFTCPDTSFEKLCGNHCPFFRLSDPIKIGGSAIPTQRLVLECRATRIFCGEVAFANPTLETKEEPSNVP